jgi:hypothetical protein
MRPQAQESKEMDHFAYAWGSMADQFAVSPRKLLLESFG